jgi:membrane associated rhomboid family serine protease
MALLLVYACLFPNREFLFMFILPIKAKYLILMIMVIEIFSATDSVNDMISHTAHLGGCAFGLLWFLYLTGGLRFRALRRLWRRRRGRGRLKLVGKGKAGEPVPLDDEELPPTIH